MILDKRICGNEPLIFDKRIMVLVPAPGSFLLAKLEAARR